MTFVRSALAALLLWLAASSGVAMADAQRDALVARWTTANTAQIANIRDAKARAAAQKAFAKVQAHLDEPTDTAAEPSDLNAMLQRELATPGLYNLSAKIAPPPNRPWYQQLWDWLYGWLQKLWNALFGNVRIGRGGALAIGDLLIGAAILALLYAVIRLLAEFQIERGRAAAVEALGASPDARALYQRARAAAGKGDFAAASRLLFAASVVALDLRGIVAEDPSATVGDLRRALRSREASLVAPFDAVAAPFVASTYAERPVAGADWERAHDAFLTFAPEGGPA